MTDLLNQWRSASQINFSTKTDWASSLSPLRLLTCMAKYCYGTSQAFFSLLKWWVNFLSTSHCLPPLQEHFSQSITALKGALGSSVQKASSWREKGFVPGSLESYFRASRLSISIGRLIPGHKVSMPIFPLQLVLKIGTETDQPPLSHPQPQNPVLPQLAWGDRALGAAPRCCTADCPPRHACC